MNNFSYNERAGRDDFCHWCGFPFDPGDKMIVTDGGYGDCFCSKRCTAAALERVFPKGHELADRIVYDCFEGKYYDRHTDLYLEDFDPVGK